jgi:hypothetical protein
MRTHNSDTKRLGCVEPSATNEGGLYTKTWEKLSSVEKLIEARKSKGKLNTVNMPAWVHNKCDIMDQDALCGLQGAWETGPLA